ncbi:MAG: hypothetical protein MJ188_00265 [Treponema sp.]|nr:hypothetical protein [Treponema sp.]
MKKINPLFVIFLGILLIVISTGAVIGGISIAQYNPKIAFYNVDPQIQKSILNSLNEEFKNNKKPFVPLVLNSEISIGKQEKQFKRDLKKCKLLIAENDMELMEFCQNSTLIQKMSGNLVEGMPSSIINPESRCIVYSTEKATETEKTIDSTFVKTVPLLFDFYQIDVNYPIYKDLNAANIVTWADYIDFCEKAKKSGITSINLNGKDEANFLNFFGTVAEALISQEKYTAVLNKLYDAYKKTSHFDFSNDNAFEKCLTNLTSQSAFKENPQEPSLYPVVQELKQLFNRNILPQNFENTSTESFYLQLNENMCASAFLKLSDHRKIQRTNIQNYKSIYCPSIDYTTNRRFCAPEIIAASLTKDKAAQEMIKWLCVNDQTRISTETGLSPVQKNCMVADQQSGDVRYWLAASQGPVFPFTAAIPAKDAQSQAYTILLKAITE